MTRPVAIAWLRVTLAAATLATAWGFALSLGDEALAQGRSAPHPDLHPVPVTERLARA